MIEFNKLGILPFKTSYFLAEKIRLLDFVKCLIEKCGDLAGSLCIQITFGQSPFISPH